MARDERADQGVAITQVHETPVCRVAFATDPQGNQCSDFTSARRERGMALGACARAPGVETEARRAAPLGARREEILPRPSRPCSSEDVGTERYFGISC